MFVLNYRVSDPIVVGPDPDPTLKKNHRDQNQNMHTDLKKTDLDQILEKHTFVNEYSTKIFNAF